MTPDQQRKLATRIAKESDFVRVKFGTTNARRVLHLAIDRPEARVSRSDGEAVKVERLAASTTIYDAVEWAYHPWNKVEKAKPEREFDRDLADAIRNREAI